jgi:hypothetical protein
MIQRYNCGLIPIFTDLKEEEFRREIEVKKRKMMVVDLVVIM